MFNEAQINRLTEVEKMELMAVATCGVYRRLIYELKIRQETKLLNMQPSTNAEQFQQQYIKELELFKLYSGHLKALDALQNSVNAGHQKQEN